MKAYLYLMTACMISACSFGGFKPAPDASASWRYCGDIEQYTDAPKSDPQFYFKFYQKKHKDMRSCHYDPMGGGDIEADACVRKKGWFPEGPDPFPENKIYEICPVGVRNQ